MTEPDVLAQVDRTYVHFRRRKLSYFSGCDYFRLASHPRILSAAKAALDRNGLNVAASRLTTGNHPLYAELEQGLRRFFAALDALLVSTGYLTNVVVAQALAGHFSHVLMDAQSHPSLRDAARFLDCPVLEFKHRDPAAVASAAYRCGPGARLLLLTDGMFSRDGAAAPLADYLRVLLRDAWLLVDDAHGAGVLGKTGKGTLEHTGVSRRRIIQTVTLSKAFGAYGGAILGPKSLRGEILRRSHAFVGSTPVPLSLAAAAGEAIRVFESDPGLRRRLFANVAYVKDALRHAGWDLPNTPGPIVMLLPKPAISSKLKQALLAAGIYPPFLKYPGGPTGGYFRFVISSEHSHEQLDQLLAVLRRFT